MYKSYRVVAVTPAGRRASMEILKSYIYFNRDIIDEWHLWVNTSNHDDLSWMREQSQDSFIRLVHREDPHSTSIGDFFSGCVDDDTIYIRFDDDIVYIHPMAINELCRARVENPLPFLVYANIINNAICTHLHQRLGAFPLEAGQAKYWCTDDVGWKCSEFAIQVHRGFLQSLQEDDLDKYLFGRWIMWEADRFSINSFAFFGKDFQGIGKVPWHEEHWLSSDYPRSVRRPTMIAGNALVSHYSYFTQKEVLDSTDILDCYKVVSEAFSGRINQSSLDDQRISLM